VARFNRRTASAALHAVQRLLDMCQHGKVTFVDGINQADMVDAKVTLEAICKSLAPRAARSKEQCSRCGRQYSPTCCSTPPPARRKGEAVARRLTQRQSDALERKLDAMADDGTLGAFAQHLAILAGADWPSLDGDAQDAWHEAAIERLRADQLLAVSRTKGG
jgi:hypothetical protein